MKMQEGEVWVLDSETGGRLLYAAGSPEAEAWLVAHGDAPMQLTDADCDALDHPDDVPKRPDPA